MQISKGLRSKEDILEHARIILNDEGLGITLAELARKLNSTLGRITYHFPTKDRLYIASGEQYQNEFRQIHEQPVPAEFDIQYFYTLASQVMDLQYKYRNVIRYMASSVKAQGEMSKHLADSFKNDRSSISQWFQQLIDAGSMKNEILHPDNFNIIMFQFTNLFTTWIINLEIYDWDKSYEEMKPIYLQGIFCCFTPYLTNKGKDELERTGVVLK